MEGQQLGGRYRLEKRIGGGGMAIVYKAKDLVLNRPVAVKVLRTQFGIDEDFVQRFRREAQAVASLSHPNVVSVYDVGQDDDTYYMVMEYVEGSTLKEVINREGALPIPEAVRIAIQICDALDHAHQNQIIHRDIKPQNILIGKNGRVKVTDFGIARAVTEATITHTGSVLGSVHYFSPEQARGGVTAEKSDIYSLGIVLYEMLTGQLPFSGDSPISVALKHLQEPLPDPRQINPQIPQSVENVVRKALVKDPFYRYQSAKDMLLDLETCLSPERLNEPKVEFPVDAEETKVLPAITPEMFSQPDAHPQRSDLEEEDVEQGGKRKWWVKLVSWVGVAGLFVILTFAGFNYLLGLLRVPEIPVPLVTGTMLEQAEEKIRDAGLVPEVVYEYSDQEENTVTRQDPAPPMRVKENATVTLYVSKGQQEVKMPRLIELNRKTAEEQLKALGFTQIKIFEQEDSTIPADQVMDQFPAVDSSVVPSKTLVTLTVSKGKPYVKMPNLIGKGLDEARLDLLKARLAEGPIQSKPSYVPEPGIVISTYPYDPGMEVQEGMEIPLTVSNGEYPAEAKIASYPVVVTVEDGKPEQVRIVISDARGDNQVYVNETITQSKQYTFTLVLSPQKDGVIEVFTQGSQTPDQKHEINYDNLP